VLVPQSLQTPIGSIQSIPPKVLAELVAGQRVDVVIDKAAKANETVAVKVGDTQLEFKTPVALKAGQAIQLELIQQNNKTFLQLVTANNAPQTIALLTSATLANSSIANRLTASSLLTVGQSVAVEVVKVLEGNRLLLQSNAAALTNDKMAKPQQFDVDVSKLIQRYKVGEQLQLQVISVKPLSIQLQAQPTTREQLILDKIQALLPQQIASSRLDSVSHLLHQRQLPKAISVALQAVVNNSIDKSQITQADSFKQAVTTSGVEMERKLLSEPTKSNQDFKANINKILQAVETVTAEVKSKLSESAINKLPSQVQAALLANGKSPTQLVNLLLSGQGKGLSTPSSLSSGSITSQQQALSLVQLLTKPLTLVSQHDGSGAKAHAAMNLNELSQLFKEVEGVYNKLQLNQLMMLKEPEAASNTTASWLFDVPIKDKQNLDLVQLQIDQQKQSQQDDDEQVWNVNLRLDTQNLGPIQASLTMHKEDVKIVLRAEKADSAELLSEHLTVLNQALDKLGVTMSQCSCICGNVGPFESVSKHTQQALTSRLLDVSA